MELFVLENEFLKITLSNFGASWLSCVVKMPQENREVLVTTTPERWHEQTAYFGGTIGRYANRIANGVYSLNNKSFILAQNNGKNSLHGGVCGADQKVWDVIFATNHTARFRTIFADGEEGFGGEVKVEVEYSLNGNQLEIQFDGICNGDTPLCLTNHAYFNLNGKGDILDHRLQIHAERYLPVRSDGIPNAPLKAVAGTTFDFRQPKKIGQDLLKDADQQAVKGYDHAFELTKNSDFFTALLSVDDLSLALSTTMPALQLYTGNWLAGQPNLTGGEYQDYAGVALEPEFFPNSPNQPELAEYGGIYYQGQCYQHKIAYRFKY